MWECQLVDSEVAALRAEDSTVALHFSALNARPLGTGDVGYALGVLLTLDGAQLLQHDGHALGRIAQGRLEQGGAVLAAWSLPGQYTGPVDLRLQFSNGASVLVQAAGWRSQFVDGPRFRESYAC